MLGAKHATRPKALPAYWQRMHTILFPAVEGPEKNYRPLRTACVLNEIMTGSLHLSLPYRALEEILKPMLCQLEQRILLFRVNADNNSRR